MSEAENTIDNAAEDAGAEGEIRRVYELGYLLVPTISEENAPVIFGNLKELIGNQGGEIVSSDMPRMIHLAYIMTKVIDNVRTRFDSAYFGWVKFEIEASKLAEIKKQLTMNKDLIRFLIVKTVRENTIAPRRYVGAGVGRMRNADRKEDEKDAVPIDKEAVDKEIDALAEAAV